MISFNAKISVLRDAGEQRPQGLFALLPSRGMGSAGQKEWYSHFPRMIVLG